MTPQDLLRDLRDIHLPPDASAVPDSGIALWPLVGLALVLGAVLAVGFWRRSAWRREARARLAALDGLGDRKRVWAALLELCVEVARRSGRAVTLPETVYWDPESVGQVEIDGLKHRILEELRR